MHISESFSEASQPFANWQKIADWAQAHYRSRVFSKDQRIPARQGLLYLVSKGAIRLVGNTQIDSNNDYENSKDNSSLRPLSKPPDLATQKSAKDEEDEGIASSEYSDDLDEAFLGFIKAGNPFEILTESSCIIHAYAHLENTEVIWLYWHDLENWPHFHKEIYEAFRIQHQRKLLWLSALGQRKTIERLMAFITLLIKEYGESCPEGFCLPYTLTHAQIGSSIGSTRVTVTRLMGKLRRQGAIIIRDDNSICLPLVTKE